MHRKAKLLLALVSLATVSIASPAAAGAPIAAPRASGVLQLRSANGFDETLARLEADVRAKGIRHFITIDQSGLGETAGLKLGRSTLVVFGNPPLGVQFLQSNPYAGLDWPVRMLVLEQPDGSVFVAWTDFAYIAKRYEILDRDKQFAMARDVAASVAGAATASP